MENSFGIDNINLELSLEDTMGYKALKVGNRLYSKTIILGQYGIWTIIDNNNNQHIDIDCNLCKSTFKILDLIKYNYDIEKINLSIFNLLFIDILYIIKIYMPDLYNAFYLTSCAEDKVDVITKYIVHILYTNFGIECCITDVIDIPQTEFAYNKPSSAIILAEHKSVISHQIGSNMTYRKEVIALDVEDVFTFYHNTLFLETQDFKTRSVQYWYKTNLNGIKSLLLNIDKTREYIKDITIKISSLYLVYNLDIKYTKIEKFITDNSLNKLLDEKIDNITK